MMSTFQYVLHVLFVLDVPCLDSGSACPGNHGILHMVSPFIWVKYYCRYGVIRCRIGGKRLGLLPRVWNERSIRGPKSRLKRFINGWIFIPWLWTPHSILHIGGRHLCNTRCRWALFSPLYWIKYMNDSCCFRCASYDVRRTLFQRVMVSV